MPTGNAVSATILNFFSSGTCLTLKVEYFEGFVNQIIFTDFMINKTNNFQCDFFKEALMYIYQN